MSALSEAAHVAANILWSADNAGYNGRASEIRHALRKLVEAVEALAPAPEFKPEGEDDVFREDWANIQNGARMQLLLDGESIVGVNSPKSIHEITADQAHRILTMLSTESETKA